MERRQLEEALRVSQQRFESIFKHTLIGMALVLLDGRWLKVNRTLCEIVGYSEEELLTKAFQDIAHPDDLETHLGHLERLLSGEIQSYLTDTSISRKEKHLVWVQLSVSLVRDGAGNPVHFVFQLQDLTEHKAVERRLSHLAYHDPLTGLSNRILFQEQLDGALARVNRRGEHLAVLYLDLDGFKEVNDALGHEVGDDLLIAVAKRLETFSRTGEDAIARLGGDEFCILIEGVANTNEALQVARRLSKSMREPFTINGRRIYSISASIGIVVKAPTESKSVRQLVREADAAMYQAKRKGKGYCEVFDPGRPVHARQSKMRLESELRRAIKEARFKLHYQPKVSIKTGRIIGWEALVRWEHPEGRLVLPAEFVPLAEETGMIIPLGWWILKEACQRTKKWQAQFCRESALAIDVNISARQLQHPTLIEEVANTLQESRLDPSNLVLEITESVSMEDVHFSTSVLRELKGLGVKIAIDDFGTGYSSLSYLKHFPVDVLKIDRSIIEGLERDPADEAIVYATITLAHALGLKAVAEGVETKEEFEKLRMLGCDFGQGYYWGRPCPGEAAATLLGAETS
jgi:diguanylate cyclase (GGDEF)-like protein/PAS domain S-box-containing protein